MKKTITTVFLTIFAALGFSQDMIPEQPIINVLPIEVKSAKVDEKASPTKKSFTYLRMGISDSTPTPDTLKDVQVVPGLGLGYRLISGASAIDISASYNRRTAKTDEGKEDTYYYTLPKANYLYYISPVKNNSVYLGGGMAWGGLKAKDKSEFVGLVPNFTAGYEMNRDAAWRSFIQVDVSQPAVAAIRKNDFPGPFAEISLGAGF